MQVNSRVQNIVVKVLDGYSFTRAEILQLLNLDYRSTDAEFVMMAANEISRAASKNRAEVHAPIDLNVASCPNNCSFVFIS